MSTLIEVDKKNILHNVMSIVAQAHDEVLATMDVDEEIKNPLNEEYFFLLKKMIKQGIIMKRLAFGKEINFKEFNNAQNIKNKNYNCVLAKTKNHKRMIMIDRKSLFFTIKEKNKKMFYLTRDSEYIKKYVKYFSAEFKKAKK